MQTSLQTPRTVDIIGRVLKQVRGGASREAAILRTARDLAITRKTVLKHLHRDTGNQIADTAVLMDDRPILQRRIVDLEGEVRRLNKEQAEALYVRERIIGLTGQMPNPPSWIVDPPKSSKSPGVPTLFCSDWHWGEVVDPGQVSGVNTYNLKIARERAKTVITHTVDLLKNHVVNPDYPGIVFALGGDLFSGDIHEELVASNEKEIMPCFLDLFGVLIWSINVLADQFGCVFVPAVTGNHSRTTQKMRHKSRVYTNYDWLLYRVLEKHFENDSRITFLIPDGPDCLYRVHNTRYALSHGDQFRGGDGIIGAVFPILRGDYKKRSRNSQIGMEYDTLLIGHWHQLLTLGKVITNGSLIGYNEFAADFNMPYEPPQQALWLTHPDLGITISMPVHAERRRINKQTQWVSWSSK